MIEDVLVRHHEIGTMRGVLLSLNDVVDHHIAHRDVVVVAVLIRHTLRHREVVRAATVEAVQEIVNTRVGEFLIDG